MLRAAQHIAAATAGGGIGHSAASITASATTLACAAAAATTAAAAAPRALLHSRAASAMRHTAAPRSWFHGTRRAGAQAKDATEDDAARSTDSDRTPSFQARDASTAPDGAQKDARLFAAAAGQWFEVEFLYGGPSRSWAIVHKPAGLSVQAGPRAHSDSLEKRLRVGYGAREIYFPHRIDKHTCGMLVVAFTRGASKALGQSLEAGQWEKKYRAICVVPPPVDMEQTAETKAPEGAAEPPLLTFTSKFPAHSYPASALVSSYLQGSLWSAAPLPSAPRPPDATDLAGSRTPIAVHLRPKAMLRSYLVRRGLPAYSTLDPQREWSKWNKAIVPAPANRASKQTASSKQDQFAMRVGSFTAASPSKDGQAYTSSPALDRRRLHPFVPETMLYESVPFKPVDPESDRRATGKTKGDDSNAQGAIDEDDVDEAEITASMQPSSDRGSVVDVPKKSVTEFTLLSSNPASRLALYEVCLHTGRSHQIRIHCADAGMPILNDPYYNPYTIYEWMRKAARSKMEDQVATHMRKDQHRSGRKAEMITLDDIVRTTNAALHAGTAASEFGCTVFPPPALPPMLPPAFSARVGPMPAKLKSTGTSITIAKGVMPRLNADKERGNNKTQPGMVRSEAEQAARRATKAARSKYENRRPRPAAAARSFFTRSGSGALSYRARYPARSEHSSSSFADGSSSFSTTTASSSRETGRTTKFKRKSGYPAAESSEPKDEPLPVGRSSVGQRTGTPSATRPLVQEHDEYDDDSERRVLKSKTRPASAQTQGASWSSQQQQQQSSRSPPRASNSSSSSSSSQSASSSYSSSSPRSPRSRAKVKPAAPRAPFEFDEAQQFEHHLKYQGRRKPFKPRPADEATKGTGAGKPQPSVKYTNRADAPVRPSWLPEHVPYRLVAPNAQVDANWQSVLSKYGVGSSATAATAGAASEGAATAGASSSVAAPERRYKDPNRGAGAVGWLVKDDPSLSAGSANVVALSTPTASSAALAPASDNHWFASQVSQPSHEMALHAFFLRFPHPSKHGEIITCVQPVSKQWEGIMKGSGERRRGNKNDEQQQQQQEEED